MKGCPLTSTSFSIHIGLGGKMANTQQNLKYILKEGGCEISRALRGSEGGGLKINYIKNIIVV